MQQAEGLFLFKYKQSGEKEERQNYKNKPRQVKNNEGKKNNNALHHFAEIFSCTAVTKYNFLKRETRQNISVPKYHSREWHKRKVYWGKGTTFSYGQAFWTPFLGD